ncbi:hypothetical protein ACWGRL_05280 [[Kitasatospora] papulosa]
MTEIAEDRTRRYLVPVARLNLAGEPDVIHLSVYQWLPAFQAWATGMAICGYSAQQGALPKATVTCPECLQYRPRYERMLTPGYRPEDDDPDVLRKRVMDLHEPVQHMGQTWCGECSVRRSTGPKTEEWVAFVPYPCPTIDVLGVRGAL